MRSVLLRALGAEELFRKAAGDGEELRTDEIGELLDRIVPHHPLLAYTSWAPCRPDDGKVSEKLRSAWLGRIAGAGTPADYGEAFKRWQESFRGPGDRTFTLEVVSRLLVGHGNSSATGVGITLHPTWGVPIVPGTALKGLVAHYVDTVYGPDDPRIPPWEQPEGERARSDFQGVVWDEKGRRILRGPGRVYRRLFGAPDADRDAEAREHGLEAGAIKGAVTFHDALCVPCQTPVLAPDVLTVHQKAYYDKRGEQGWPNDYEDPNPVAFLSVPRGVQFLFALSAPPDAPELGDLAERLLREALQAWGVGGKTSSGYGRFGPARGVFRSATASAWTAPASPQASRLAGGRGKGPRYGPGEKITVTRIEDPKGKGRAFFEAEDGYRGMFSGPTPPVPVGEQVTAWVAIVRPDGYTFSLSQPKKGGPRDGQSTHGGPRKGGFR